MGSIEEKMEVMVRKKELGREVFVNEDLQKEGREVQKRLWWVAYEERKKGKRVVVGCGGLWIDGKWFRWDEEEEKLKEG